jgi:hypothetical protein
MFYCIVFMKGDDGFYPHVIFKFIGRRIEMATKINGIEMPTDFGAALSGTPEDAAKAFMRAATKGMADVMRDALIAAIGDTVGAPPAPDWTKFISGCVLQMDWETPPGTPIQTVTAFSSNSSGLGSFDVSIGLTGHF